MSVRSVLETATTVVLAACAIAVTGVIAKHELSPRVAQAAQAPTPRLAEWPEYSKGTKRIGEPNAAVTVLEVSDFQCPFCKKFAASMHELQQKYGRDLQVVYVNYPLTQIHPYARPAAIAAECAARAGVFGAYHDRLFALQDSLRTVDWTTVAREVGIADTAAFRTCLTSEYVLGRLRADSTVAEQLKISGTPTVWVNGWKFDGTPTTAQVDSVIRQELAATKRSR